MSRTSNRRLGPLLAAAGLLAACQHEPVEPSREKAAAPAPPAAVVDTALVDERAMPEYLLVTGTLMPNQESRVAAGVGGKVLVTHVERGSAVTRGQVLATLDTRTVSASVAEAQAVAQTARTQREQAKIDCERSKALYATNTISKAEYDRTESQCEAAQSQAEAAEARARSLSANLGDAEIRAPFNGYVAERNISAGEYVQPATIVATVMDTDPLRLELSVPESAAQEMKKGLSVEFHLAASEERRFQGLVRYVGPSVRRQSRDLLVEALVENHDHALIPGMFASARVHLGDPRRATVAAAAVRTDGSLHHVFVVREGRAEDRIVQLGEARGDRVAILDGVKPGEVVALQPSQLVDGQTVKAR